MGSASKLYSAIGIIMKPVIRQPKMNKTEEKYAWYLEGLKRAKEIVSYKFEAITLNLAYRTSYTPDFIVVTKDRIEIHEVKGHWRDDARVKFKVAAEKFPEFAFYVVKLGNRGVWDIKEHTP
jgi:hypothetical protein